jgi:hypothetical protein
MVCINRSVGFHDMLNQALSGLAACYCEGKQFESVGGQRNAMTRDVSQRTETWECV